MATHATVWSGLLSSAESSISVGYLVVLDGDTFKIATTANRASYGRVVGVAITAADATARSFEYQVAGVVPAATSGLAAGTVSWVRASATGTFERCTPGSGDDLVGKCNAAGDVVLSLGAWDSSNYAGGGGGGGGTTPTGTGFRHVTAGTEDAASAKVNLTASADVTVPTTGIVTSNGSVLASFAPGTGVQTFLTTPSSANLRAALTDETGTGAAVFGTSPTFLTNVSMGATPATFGEIRLSNNWFVWARDVGNGTNISLLGLSASDVITLGGALGGGANIEVDAGASRYVALKGQEVYLKGNNVQIGTYSGATMDVGGGVGCVGLDDATSLPSTNPTGGIVLYSESGTLKYRQPAGTVVTVGNGFTAPTGTGVVTVTSGALDAASTGTTGSGNFVRATSPTLVTPTLGAASATSLTLSTPLSAANGGTGLSSLGANVATMLGTFSSANIAAACTDETGSAGNLVFSTNPSLTGPTLTTSVTLSTSGMATTASGNSKGTSVDKAPVNVQTTNATPTSLDTISLASNTAITATWIVTAVKSDISQSAHYSVSCGYKNNAGTMAQVGSTLVTVIGESNSAWDCSVSVSGTTISLDVTGVAATTIQWTAIRTHLTAVP
jgi:hypothetical protein